MGSSQDVGDFSTTALARQRCSVGSSLRYQPTPSTRKQCSAQDFTFEALHRVYFYDAWRVQPVLDAPESDLVLQHGCCWARPNLTPEVLSISGRDPDKEEQEVQEGQSSTFLAVTDAAMAEEDANEAVSIHSSSSESPTIPSTEQPEEDDARMADDASASTSSAEEEGDCLSNRPALPDVPREMKCWRQKMMQEACYLHRMWTPQVAAPHHNHLSSQSNEDRGPRPVPGELSPRRNGNHLLHHPGNHSAAFLNMSNHRPHWQTWPVRMLKIW